jgi:hypothetical protein
MLNLNLNSISVFRGGPAGPSYDPDAQAFFDATGLADPTQMTLINTMVVDLKGNGLWTHLKALYPFAGDTATIQKYNLIDPRDLDAAFRLDFNGGWTHEPGNAIPNGINGYADTHLNPVSNLTQPGNLYYGLYINQYTSPSGGGDMFGTNLNTPPSYRVALWRDGASKNCYFTHGNGATFVGAFGEPGIQGGLFAFNRQNSGAYQLSQNVVDYVTGNDGGLTPSTGASLFIGTFNGAGNNYSDAHFGAVVIANKHFNSSEQGQLKSILDAWQAGL